jgi:uncharacterized protein YqgV (UPF0045/DUF77 family)
MIAVSAQFSLYPLGQADLAPAIAAALAALDECGLPYETGSMSTVTWGDHTAVFAALQEAFRRASILGGAVMAVTVSNACPLPAAHGEAHHG